MKTLAHLSSAFTTKSLALAATLTTTCALAAQVAVVGQPYPVASPVIVRSSTTGDHLIVMETGLPGQRPTVTAWQCGPTFGSPIQIMRNAGRRPTAAYCAGTNRWVIAYDDASVVPVCYVYSHAYGAPFGSGRLNVILAQWSPQLAGYASPQARSNNVLLATETVDRGFPHVNVMLWNTATDAAVDSVRFPEYDNFSPSVARLVWDERSPWYVAVRNDSTDYLHSQVRVMQYGSSLGREGYYTLRTAGVHAIQPRVAGEPGGYLLTWMTASDRRSEVGAELWAVPLKDGVGPGTRTRIAGGTLAVDQLAMNYHTREHFGLTYRRVAGTTATTMAVSLGFDGRVVASRTLPTNSGSSGIAWDGRTGMRCVFGDNRVLPLVWVDTISLDPTAGARPFGVNCSRAAIEFWGHAYAGSRPGRVALLQAPANALAILFIGASPGQVPLDALGMTGCTLLMDPARVVHGCGATTDGAGNAAIPIPATLDLRDAYLQFAHTSTANSFGLVTTRGIHLAIR